MLFNCYIIYSVCNVYAIIIFFIRVLSHLIMFVCNKVAFRVCALRNVGKTYAYTSGIYFYSNIESWDIIEKI